MSLWYRFFYGVGITPWEEDPVAGAAAPQIAALFEREEQDRRPPYGPALDLGCGSGIWSVALANRGWLVTGVDIVPKAIRRARVRAAAAGVEEHTRFLQGDVAALREAGVEPGFRFVLDFECFNHLTDAQRRDVGREDRWPIPPQRDRSSRRSECEGDDVGIEEEAHQECFFSR